MDLKLFKELIQRGESNTLDYKREMYTFTPNASKNLKKTEDGEFIKDLLSFYNTQRSDSAYIICGIEEDQNLMTNNLVGITKTIDEAILQNKVKDKIKPIIDFSVEYLDYQGKKFAVITIPLPQYSIPSVPIDNYGPIRKNVVYLRRGSTCGEATHEEIEKLYSWLKELEVLRKKQLYSTGQLKAFIKDSIKNEMIFEKAQPIIKEQAEELGISDDELDLLIEKAKQNEFKKASRIPGFFILLFSAALFVVLYFGISSDIRSSKYEKKIDKLIALNKFDEARDSLILYPINDKKNVLRKIMEEEVKEILRSGATDSAIRLIASYHLDSSSSIFEKGDSEVVKGQKINRYNIEANWLNSICQLIFNSAIIDGKYDEAKQVIDLLIVPIIKIDSDGNIIEDSSLKSKMKRYLDDIS